MLTIGLMTSLIGCGTSAATSSETVASESVQETTAQETDIQESTTQAAASEEQKVLRVGIECAYAPFNWVQTDESNGAIKTTSDTYANGYDVMYAMKIADELGYTLEIHKIDWESLILELQSNNIDAVISGMCMTEERMQSVDFTTPYYYADFVVLTRNDSEYAEIDELADLAGAAMTSQMNTTWYEVLNQIEGAEIQPAMETLPASIVALSSGKVDAIVVDKPSALSAMKSNPELKMIEFEAGKGFDISEEETNLGIAVRKEDAALKEAINEVIAGITDEERESMMEKAIEIQPLSE